MNADGNFRQFLFTEPKLHPTAYIAPLCYLTGDVTVGECASIWPQTSLRGDVAPIVVGDFSNVQDGAVLHVADDLPCLIGSWVTIGHKAIVHAAEVGDGTLVGMGSIILDGAKIGACSIVGANATVTPGTVIPPGSLVLGSPATVKRALTAEEQDGLRVWAERYVTLSRLYLERAATAGLSAPPAGVNPPL